MKVLRGERELSEKDLVELPKGLIPGEWIFIADAQAQKKYIAYANPYADIFFKVKIITEENWKDSANIDEFEMAKKCLSKLIALAVSKRDKYISYEKGCRLIYGFSDSLPGLIVDKYKKYILVQVNTAGLDRFRDLIRLTLKNLHPEHEVVFFDNEEYRKAEVLPQHEKEKINEDLEVIENDLSYKIPQKVLQKIGYYYDHRENRARLKNLIERLKLKKSFGLDLFSYVGAWGLHMLSAGVENVEFVDQGDMQEAIAKNLQLNSYTSRGSFIRSDVFKFLDNAHAQGRKFDIIVSDPPAFTKTEKNKAMALQGYEKLHFKALRVLEDEGLFVAASCTHYSSHEEIDRTVQEAAFRNGQKLQLLDLGLQGFDHPITSLKDKSFYIKYLVYYVNRG